MAGEVHYRQGGSIAIALTRRFWEPLLSLAPAKSIRKDGGITANALRAIARANAGAMMRAYGVRWGEEGAEFPRGE